jgi:intracellular septation protein A
MDERVSIDMQRSRARADSPPHAQHELLKHWRAFGSAEWQHVKDGALGLLLGSVLPVALFYVALRVWSFPVAVLAVLGWSAAIFAWHRRRTGDADVFSAATFGFACLQAAIGLVSQSPSFYLAVPTLENVLYGSAFLGSALAGRPLLALYVRRLYPVPARVQRAAAFGRAFRVTSAVWFVGLTLRGLLRLWLLVSLPLEWYLVVNTIAGWPFSVTLVAFTAWYPLRELRRAGLIAQTPAVVGDLEEAVEEAVAGSP